MVQFLLRRTSSVPHYIVPAIHQLFNEIKTASFSYNKDQSSISNKDNLIKEIEIYENLSHEAVGKKVGKILGSIIVTSSI